MPDFSHWKAAELYLTLDLDPELDRPRTETLSYRFPPARPMAPPAHECDREQLLDLAAGAARGGDDLWSLVGSQDHVSAICRLATERLEPELAAALSRAARLELDLAGACTAHSGAVTALAASESAAADYRVLHLAELTERMRLARLHGKLAGENAQLRRELKAVLATQRIEASFERLTVTVTGESYAVVAERLTAAVVADQRRCIDALFDDRDRPRETDRPREHADPESPSDHLACSLDCSGGRR